jgi:predicted nucleotidyltransferase component of viral defense system
MSDVLKQMLERYQCRTVADYQNALKEIIQEIALLGLWRAKFFEHAAFCGGSALRILYGLDRFSEDLDFSLIKPQTNFSLNSYNKAVQEELLAFGLQSEVYTIDKSSESQIQSAFIKAGTKLQMISIGTPVELYKSIPSNQTLKIKFEIDIDPPSGFRTEAKTLLQPIPFAVQTYCKPDLFAGKLHAILCRSWKERVKGRDWYDLVWYISKGISVNLEHLRQRLVQSGKWQASEPFTLQDLLQLLATRIEEVDFAFAQNDVVPFLKDPAGVALWGRDFFLEIISSLATGDGVSTGSRQSGDE